ncbi:MAG TPA: methylated-DNA--[protein]-cysteine S-methyltransferase [Dehalococcoidia bacterium]|nr:methylated-DNA--[protein]-cysteine S-methyltransferase [Dehalococcoidia bacterium]
MIYVSRTETPFGLLYLASTDRRLIASAGPDWARTSALAWGALHWPAQALEPAGALHRPFHRQVAAYFLGRLRRFELELALDGDTLVARGWRAALEIPFACTLTYGELALDAGAPGAARAMGRSMSLCPLPLFVPCHRVVGAGGKPCGNRESWQKRESLLAFERGCSAAT